MKRTLSLVVAVLIYCQLSAQDATVREIQSSVTKEIKKDTVKTNIRELDNEERITAIAKMLSGEKPTAAAMENAREMLN